MQQLLLCALNTADCSGVILAASAALQVMDVVLSIPSTKLLMRL
jgi:hypothetical protein